MRHITVPVSVLLITILLLIISSCDARLFEGQCRKRPVPVITMFDLDKYLGEWYELEWYDDEYPTDDECIKFTYTENGQNALKILLESRHANDNFRYESFKGHGLVSYPNDISLPGQLNTTYGTGVPKRVDYEILVTDYTTFSFVWDCRNVNGTHYNERFWYLARDAHQSERIPQVDYLLEKYFDQRYIRTTYHGPECMGMIGTRQSVVNFNSDFSSINMSKTIILTVLISFLTISLSQHIVDHECPSRPVLTNFDLSRYLVGPWYEISRYEQYFERGCECGFAEYSLNDDGSVKVKNCCKRLPNTTLSCSIGKAVLSYPNSVPLEAKLSVAFRGEPNESNYWILDTDYDNFAIVYFCKPAKDDPSKSAEAFWLLSKTKVLGEEYQKKADDYVKQYFDKTAIKVVTHDSDKCGSD
uniref:Apolipoprotein D n=1 Tax=Culicoides sonorensis TaxID=179676 RepID=A0A336MYN8_CULSO